MSALQEGSFIRHYGLEGTVFKARNVGSRLAGLEGPAEAGCSLAQWAAAGGSMCVSTMTRHHSQMLNTVVFSLRARFPCRLAGSLSLYLGLSANNTGRLPSRIS